VRVRSSGALGLAPLKDSAPTIGGGAHGFLGISSLLPCHLDYAPLLGEGTFQLYHGLQTRKNMFPTCFLSFSNSPKI
jgi:hypothetical protein